MTSESGSLIKEHAPRAAIATPGPDISGFSDDPPPINPRNLVWVALAFLVLAVVIAVDDIW